MRDSTKLQDKIVGKLKKHLDAEKEWPIRKNADDIFSNKKYVYAPQLDVAVGPFSTNPGNMLGDIRREFESKAPKKLQKFVEDKALKENPNPRCMLAIEVAYSGSSKHMLGDITNASMMGLYGFVIGSVKTIDKLNRILEYSKIIKHVGKAPADLFSNACVILDEDFMKLLNRRNQ